MVKEAEANADADRAAKEAAEVRNTADSLVYQSEKALKDFGDKVGADERSAIEAAITDLKGALEGDDIEAIKAKSEQLSQASQKLAEEMYKAQAEAGDAGGDEGGDAEQSSGGPQGDDVEDADYEVVDEDK